MTDRRRNPRKREFLEYLFEGQTATRDRALFMEIATYMTHKMAELQRDCGAAAMMNIILELPYTTPQIRPYDGRRGSTEGCEGGRSAA